jgi:hypothetical protein
MKENLLETKLTPAAREVLDELVDDFKHQLLNSAAESASSISGEIREISIRDILKGLETTQLRHQAKKLAKGERVALLYAGIGLMLLILTTVFEVFGESFLPLNSSFSSLIGLIGITTALTALFMLLWLRRRELSDIFLSSRDAVRLEASDYSMVFVRKWRELELEARAFVSDQFGESRANIPIPELVNYLHKGEVLSIADEKIFMNILRLRNTVLHKGEELSQAQYLAAIKDADNLLSKIRKKP